MRTEGWGKTHCDEAVPFSTQSLVLSPQHCFLNSRYFFKEGHGC